jgi:hypothetical protein
MAGWSDGCVRPTKLARGPVAASHAGQVQPLVVTDVSDASVSCIPVKLNNLTCSCGETDLISVAPGLAQEIEPDLFALTPEPMRAWCPRCWRERYGPGSVSRKDIAPRP